MKKVNLLLSAFIAFALLSCSDDENVTDLEKPVITELKINESEDEAIVAAGGEMHLEFQFSDNNGLGQARMDIHDAFDGHAHGRISNLAKFQWETVLYLNNQKTYTDHLDIDVPETALAGPYHFDVIITDAAGNESDFALLDFIVTNAAMAQINVSTPANFGSTEIDASAGGTMAMNFTATDAEGLDEIYVMIHEEHDHSHSERTSEGEEYELLHITHETLEGLTSYTVDQTFTLPATLVAGEHYKLEILVIDEEGNYSFAETILHVD